MDALDHDISDEHALLVVHTECEGLLIQDFAFFKMGVYFQLRPPKQ